MYIVDLVAKSEYAVSVLKRYKGKMYLIEFDSTGRPLNIAPSGEQGIFCISPDGVWNGWFLLDKDVMFTEESIIIQEIIDDLKT
jgi:hypothetical protein